MPPRGRSLAEFANPDYAGVSPRYTDADLRRRVELPETEVLDTYGVPYANEAGVADRLLREAKESLASTEALSRSLQQGREKAMRESTPRETYQSPPARILNAITTSIHPKAPEIRELMSEVESQPLAYSGESPMQARMRGLLSGSALATGGQALYSTSPGGFAMEVAPSLRGISGGLSAAQQAATATAAANRIGRPAANLAPDLWSKAPSSLISSSGLGTGQRAAMDVVEEGLNRGLAIEDAITAATRASTRKMPPAPGIFGSRMKGSLESLYGSGRRKPWAGFWSKERQPVTHVGTSAFGNRLEEFLPPPRGGAPQSVGAAAFDPALAEPNPIDPAQFWEDLFNLTRR